MKRLFASLVKLLLPTLLMAAYAMPALAANTKPTISGNPVRSVVVNTAYQFLPSAKDADNNTLTFFIINKPSWATFSTSTGLLSGKPTIAGKYSTITVGVTDGNTRAYLPAFSITVTASSTSTSTTNSAPVISGTPSTSVTAGSAYSFKPTAVDANGDALGFSISNKPSWSTFNTTTGQLSGTPTSSNVGSYVNVTVSVSDGKVSTSLSPFSIAVAVAAAATTTGNATLSWSAPSTNTDGSALTDLAGYKIYYGSSSGNLTNSVSVGVGLSAYVVSNLASGTWYFAITALNSSGVESSMSSVASKTI